MEHKIAHGGIGFASGTMAKLWQGEGLGKAIKQGGVIGTVTGSTVEVFACALPQHWDPKLRGDIAKLTTTASSMFTRFDPEITKSVAVNAIDNNFVPMAAALAEASPLVIGAGKVAWEIYSLTHEEELQEYHDKAVDQVSDWTGFSHDNSEKIVDVGMMVGSTARAIKQGVKKVGANLVINKAKSEIKNAVTLPVKTPAKTSVNPPVSAKPPVKNAASANPAPKLVEKKTPPAKPSSMNPPVKTSPAKTSVNPPAKPNVVEKKTPNFMVETASSKMREITGDNLLRVRKINDRMPMNHQFANKVYPLEKLPENLRQKYPHSVPFTGTGHPDFSRYAIKKVEIKMTGVRRTDDTLANSMAGYSETPKGYTWHHHHDGKTMMLVPRELHKAVDHTGGVAIVKNKGK